MLFLQKISFVLLLACVLTACQQQQQPDAYDTHGKAIYFSQYHGQWLVINYWASWCKPCWQEIPELNAFAKHYQAQKIVVFGVNYDKVDNQKLQQFITKMNIQFPTLTSDPAKKLGISNVETLPTTFIINPDGKLVKTLSGEQTQKTLQQALGLT